MATEEENIPKYFTILDSGDNVTFDECDELYKIHDNENSFEIEDIGEYDETFECRNGISRRIIPLEEEYYKSVISNNDVAIQYSNKTGMHLFIDKNLGMDVPISFECGNEIQKILTDYMYIEYNSIQTFIRSRNDSEYKEIEALNDLIRKKVEKNLEDEREKIAENRMVANEMKENIDLNY